MEEGAWLRRLLTVSRHLPPPQPLPASSPTLHGCALRSLSEAGEPVVIGGMVLDIHATPHAATRPGTSTPGKIEYVRGGVARNIAECMATLGLKPFMISVLGNDMAGNMLLRHWKSLRLATEGILTSENTTTPVVINIFDSDGELASAVASVEAVEKCLSIFWIEHFRHKVYSAPILMIDANLQPQLLHVACQIAEGCGVPVWFEPVSVIKSERVASIAKYITFTSPNEHELIAMANALSLGSQCFSYCDVDEKGERFSPEDIAQRLKPAICFLLDQGIKVVVVTLGSNGMLLCSREDPNFMQRVNNKVRSTNQVKLYELVHGSCSSHQLIHSINTARKNYAYALHFHALPASVVSLTGAGDCLVGGAIASICSGLDLICSMAVAVSVAKAAVESKLNVPPDFSLKDIADDAKLLCSAARLFILR